MKIAINQPTYLPWLGYFDLIDQVDLFVALDNVQFSRQSWQQRNRVKTPAGLQWLTVPVQFRGRSGQLVKDVEIRDPAFCRSHIRAIELAYGRAEFFDDHFVSIQQILERRSSGLLVDLNLDLITWMMRVLQISTPVVRAFALGVNGHRTELLAEICTALGATEYVSPLGSATYLLAEQEILRNRGVEISFQRFVHPEYSQLFGPFTPFASAIDLIFNHGASSLAILRSGRRPAYSADEVAAMDAATSSGHAAHVA